MTTLTDEDKSISEELRAIYHVVKVDSNDSFLPTTKNIIYTGGKDDAQEIFSKRIAESPNERYALVCETIAKGYTVIFDISNK